MKQKKIVITPEYIKDLILRRRWYILVPLSFALIAGIIMAVVTPRIYEAKTLILVEGQRVPQNYVQPIVTEETSERVSTISQEILSRTNIERIIKDFSLFSGPEHANMFIEQKVEIVRKKISINVITDRRWQTDAFEISFKGKDPEKVMRVVNGLTEFFIDENLKVRESQAIGTTAFLESELESTRIRLEQVEEKMKEYRRTNMGELPEQLETNLRILERLQDNLSDKQQDLRDAKIRLVNLKDQASVRQPSVVVIGGDQQQLEGTTSLDELIARLETLKGRYTDQHPDIIRLKRQIKDLETNEKAAASKFEKSKPQTYDRLPAALRSQMLEVEREIQLAKSGIEDIEQQIEAYQKRVENSPKREQELLSLGRDYENIKASYDSLQKRKLEADIAVNLERKQKGERFRIVDPARIPQRPVEPDLIKLFAVVVMAGLGFGCGLAYALEYLNPSFQMPHEIEDALGINVLSAIPSILSPKQIFIKRIEKIGSIAYTVVTACLLAAMGTITVLWTITNKGA